MQVVKTALGIYCDGKVRQQQSSDPTVLYVTTGRFISITHRGEPVNKSLKSHFGDDDADGLMLNEECIYGLFTFKMTCQCQLHTLLM